MPRNQPLPPPGIWGGANHWPFSIGVPSVDYAGGGKDTTTLMEDYGGWANQPGPGDDIGPTSQNVEDRRGEKFVPPGLLDMLRAEWRGGHFAYPGRRYGSYDADIDASLQRAEAMNAATPALRELARRENWFRVMDRPEEPGPEPPERVQREYRRARVGNKTYRND
jgi:hypothetical protein